MKNPSAKELPSVILFAAVLYQDEKILNSAEERLTGAFGVVLKRSSTIPFDFTRYYCQEMGTGLKRLYIAFEKVIDPGELPRLKHWTNQLESEFSSEGKRRVNIDPGYLNLARVVLASTKDAPHRLYLVEGIFGEITLMFEKGTFQPLSWTYPDYRTQESLRFFNEHRDHYKTYCRSNPEVLHARAGSRFE